MTETEMLTAVKQQIVNFECYAADQEASIRKRWVVTKADIAECRGKAYAWRDAATELRKAFKLEDWTYE